MKKSLISVVIPVYNEQEHIVECITSLLKQSYKLLEIIVVDDGSTDKTRTFLKAFPQVRVLEQVHKGPGHARNLGSKKAKGDILVFVDADMTFSREFIEQLTKPIREGKTIGTFSKDEYVANYNNPWARAWSLVRGFGDGKMHPANYPDTQPVFRAILKREFVRVGGFDINRGYDDDWSLSERLGILAVATTAHFYHYNPSSVGEIFNQAKWMSKRTYKWGLIGMAIAIFRSLPPLSIIKSLYQTMKHKDIYVGLSQLIIDVALLMGIFSPRKSK